MHPQFFSPAYAQQYFYPYRQVDPNTTYPGPSITHTVGQNGPIDRAAKGMLVGGLMSLVGGILGAGFLGVYMPLRMMAKTKMEDWAKALIIVLLTFPLGGFLGALPGFIWGSVAVFRAAEDIAPA